MLLFGDMPVVRDARFSDCKKYRYKLWRVWDETKPMLMFIGLNPSDANEKVDDPTIRSVMRLAKFHGFGSVYMLNLFGIIDSNPKVLQTCADPIGVNDKHLKEMGAIAGKIVFAWGAFQVQGRDRIIEQMFPDAWCLGYTKSGAPLHPLFIKHSTPLVKYERRS